MNHRSLDPKAFTHPGDVSDTANSIAALLQYLPQALEQLQAGITALYEQNAIRLDDRPEGTVSEKDIADQVLAVISGLKDAREDVARAHESIRRATSPLSHMGGHWEDAEDGE
ncbi:hypothetical protein [Streptomyces sp. NPDC005548]|uniref:hypothetical protein n=1 Tax=Streptomyces sp. NPDC005548 TaxID=3364724 RepID=UPI00369D7C84